MKQYLGYGLIVLCGNINTKYVNDVFFFCLQLVPFTVYVHLLLPAFLPSFTKHMMTCKSFDAVSVVFFHVTSLFGMMN